MMYFLYPIVFIILLIITLLSGFLAYRHGGIRYLFPALQMISLNHAQPILQPKKVIWIIRLLVLISLAVVCARLIRPKNYSMRMNGIDIMLVMDVSGSMELFDDLDDRRSRLTIAKEEAQKFTQARLNDSVGVIIFASGAAVRCPVTFDKNMVNQILGDLSTRSLNPDGTWFSTALAQGARKLADSPAASKIIIVLTDGTPSPDDMKPEIAISLLKEVGVKVYTIGIGSPKGGLIEHPLYGLVTIPTPLNSSLLKHIAQHTGGRYFEAKNASDMAQIYKTIDALEKTERDIPWWLQGYELKQPILWSALLLSIGEMILRLWWLLV